MTTVTHEIGDNIFRLCTHLPEIMPPAGFTFCQFLVRADEPFLFHCGPRAMFGQVSEAVAKLIPVESLRWIGFGHVESDECGAMNQWLAAAPNAQVVHGMTACMVSLNDLADRTPRPLADGEVLDLGGKRMRYIDTPHVPHGWEAGVYHEETTSTLLCGDLLSHLGNGPALTEADLLAPAFEAEEMFNPTSLGPTTAPTIRRLAELAPTTLAVMHGSSFRGDGAATLTGLADYYAERLHQRL